MPRKVDSASQAAKNRRIRQQALREQLSAQGHVQHVVEITSDLRDDVNAEVPKYDYLALQKAKFVVDTKLRLIAKYLPDTKEEIVSDVTDIDKAISEMSDEELQRIAQDQQE